MYSFQLNTVVDFCPSHDSLSSFDTESIQKSTRCVGVLALWGGHRVRVRLVLVLTTRLFGPAHGVSFVRSQTELLFCLCMVGKTMGFLWHLQ